MKKKHPVTGCRADTVVGVWWLYEESALRSLVDAVWTVISNEERFREVAARSAVLNAGDSEDGGQDDVLPYTVKDSLAMLSISGPLTKYQTSFSSMFGGTAMTMVRKTLRNIRTDPDVRGVFIDADSWGGTAEGTAELAEAIRRTDRVKPVFVHAEDKATSGMLWVATQGRRFTASPAASIGSQGTILKLLDTSGEDHYGKPVIITTGRFKALGAQGLPITEVDKAELQRIVNSINKPFHDQVVSARRLTPAQDREVSTARVFIGPEAVTCGLIDEVCHTEEAFQHALQAIKGGTADGGPVPRLVTTPAAPERKATMALNPQQIQRARAEIPGASTVTDEQLEGFLLDFAVQQKAAGGEAVQLRTQLAQVRAQVPTKVDPTLLKGMAQLETERLQLMVEKGQILPAQLEMFRVAVSTQPNGEVTPLGEALLTPVVGGESPMRIITNMLSTNKPHGLVKEVSAGQPAPKTEPGAPSPLTKRVTYERYCELMNDRGMTPVARTDWETRQIREEVTEGS